MACKLDTSDHHHLFPTIPQIVHSFKLHRVCFYTALQRLSQWERLCE